MVIVAIDAIVGVSVPDAAAAVAREDRDRFGGLFFGLGMQHGLDLLVAASQVACGVGILDVGIVGQALSEDAEQLVRDDSVVKMLCELLELLGSILVKVHRRDPVGKGRGGARLLLLRLVRFITLAKGRWGHRGVRLFQFSVFLFVIHGFDER